MSSQRSKPRRQQERTGGASAAAAPPPVNIQQVWSSAFQRLGGGGTGAGDDDDVVARRRRRQQQQPSTAGHDDSIHSWTDDEVLEVADAMRRDMRARGLICDRRWIGKVYKRCFLYSDAVEWLTELSMRRAVRHDDDSSAASAGSGRKKDEDGSGGGGGAAGAPAAQSSTPQSVAPTLEEGEAERGAVRLGNRLIDAGYVSHVKNAHRFAEGKSEQTLFFRFHDETLDRDLVDLVVRKTIRDDDGGDGGGACECPSPDDSHVGKASSASPSREEREIERLWSELNRTRTNVSHLSEAIISTSCLLNEANRTILLLEACIVVVMCVAGAIALALLTNPTPIVELAPQLLPQCDVGRGGDTRATSYSSLAVIMLIIVAVGMWRRWRQSALMEGARDHVSLLAKIAEGRTEELVVVPEEASSLGEEEEDSVPVHRGHRPPPVRMGTSGTIGKRISEISRRFTIVKPREKIVQLRESSDVPPPSEWPHRPVMVCANTAASPLLKVPEYGDGPCPIGVPFRFESELFDGTVLLRFRDVPSDDVDGTASYFDGRQRQFQAIIQGRFREELRVSDVLTGHEFVRPLKRLPPRWIVGAGTKLIRRLAPGSQMDLYSDRPKMLAILAATSQAVSADMPGNEPLITNRDIGEDCTVFGGEFSPGRGMTVSKRKKLLSDPEVAALYMFDTESIYTFDFYQHLLDVGTYSLDLGFIKIAVSPSMDGQPIQVLAKTVDGRYLWSFQIWHEALVKKSATL